MKIRKRCLVLMSAALIITACGGGGSSSSNNKPEPVSHALLAAGTYEGSSTSNIYADSATVIGIVAQDGRTFFITSEGGQFAGSISETNDTVGGTLTGYAPIGFTFADGSQITTINFTGNVAPKKTLTGNYSGGGDQGTLSLVYQSSYEENSSLSKVAGNFGFTDNSNPSAPYTISVSIDSAGLVTGSDTNGCIYNGQVKLIDSNYNAYGITVSITSCGQDNGSYNGLATLLSEKSKDDTLVVGVSNKTESATELLTRE